MRQPLRTLTVLGLLAASAPAAQPKGIHIRSSRQTSFTWVLQDALGYRWDISNNGMVSDGTNDAYDGGMQLQVGGSGYSGVSQGRLSKDGREVEIGPWTRSGVKIYRRIFVNVKAGYCRWIDIFQNPAARTAALPIRYYFNMGDGTHRVHASSGKPALGKADWGVVTCGSSSSSSRPAVVHVFASPHAELIPRFQHSRGNDTIYYHATVKVPPRKTVALCFFQAQRRPYAAAVKMLKAFNPSRELRLVPRALRRILLNMGSATLQVGPVEVRRDEEADLVVLRNGDEIRGRIANERYVLRTEFGEMTFPAGRVLALSCPGGPHRPSFAVLADGQVVAGELTSGPVVVAMTAGSRLEVPAKGLLQAAYRIGPGRPEEVFPAEAMVVLRSGPRLAFDAKGLTLPFDTAHGPVELTPGHLKAIELDTAEGGLHRAVFANGSVLAGLLARERVELTLALGPSVNLPRQRVRRLTFPGGEVDRKTLASLTLRNDDVLHGRFAQTWWTVRTRFGDVKVATADIAEVTFSDESLGRIKATLRTGTKIGGHLAEAYVRFRIHPGSELRLHVGQVRDGVGAEVAPPKPTTRPTTNPATRTVGRPPRQPPPPPHRP